MTSFLIRDKKGEGTETQSPGKDEDKDLSYAAKAKEHQELPTATTN